MDRKR